MKLSDIQTLCRTKTTKNTSTQTLLRNIHFFRSFHAELQIECETFDDFLDQTPLADLLIYLVLWLEETTLKGLQHSEDTFFSATYNNLEICSLLLNRKKSRMSRTEHRKNLKLTADSLFERMGQLLLFEGGKQLNTIRAMGSAYNDGEDCRHRIELYCLHDWQLEQKGKKAILTPPSYEELRLWKRNGMKYRPWNTWYMQRMNMSDLANKIFSIPEDSKRKHYNSIFNLSCIMQYLETGLPEEIKFHNRKFSFNTYFNIVNFTARYSRERYLAERNEVAAKPNMTGLQAVKTVFMNAAFQKGIMAGPIMTRHLTEWVSQVQKSITGTEGHPCTNECPRNLQPYRVFI